jgi:branched-chain amino acid transport system substrate-binding protein
VSVVKQKNPGLVYYGGEYPEASLISSQMKSGGLRVPLMGGDGIYDPTYIKVAKANAEGDYATSVGAPTDQLDSAKQFVADYKAAGYSEGYSAYGAYAYDAANVVINALAKVLPGKDKIDDSVKQAIVDAVQNTNTNGVTGAISFDQYGDTTNKVLTVYTVKGGNWVPAKTEAFNE